MQNKWASLLVSSTWRYIIEGTLLLLQHSLILSDLIPHKLKEPIFKNLFVTVLSFVIEQVLKYWHKLCKMDILFWFLHILMYTCK